MTVVGTTDVLTLMLRLAEVSSKVTVSKEKNFSGALVASTQFCIPVVPTSHVVVSAAPVQVRLFADPVTSRTISLALSVPMFNWKFSRDVVGIEARVIFAPGLTTNKLERS